MQKPRKFKHPKISNQSIRFIIAGIITFAIDSTVFLWAYSGLANLVFSNIIAGAISATINFNLQRFYVFRNFHNSIAKTLWRYFLSFVFERSLNTLLTGIFLTLGTTAFQSKLGASILGAFFGFVSGRTFIFQDRAKNSMSDSNLIGTSQITSLCSSQITVLEEPVSYKSLLELPDSLRHKFPKFLMSSSWIKWVESNYGGKFSLILIRKPNSRQNIVGLAYRPKILRFLWHSQKVLTFGAFYDRAMISEEFTETDILYALRNWSLTNEISKIHIRWISSELCTHSDCKNVVRLLKLHEASFGAYMSSPLRSRTRNTLRKAAKLDHFLEITDSVNDFYNLYLHNMKSLGTPHHKKSFFESILEPGNQTQVLSMRDSQSLELVASIIVEVGEKKAFYIAAARNRDFDNSITGTASTALVAEFISMCFKSGVWEIDFGRSRREGGVDFFKEQWGGELFCSNEIELEVKTGQILDKNKEVLSGLTKIITFLWSRLPIALLRKLGPKMRKHIF